MQEGHLMKLSYRLFLAAVIGGLVFWLDQWTKEVALQTFVTGQAGEIVVTSFFNLILVWNRGVSFGMLAEHDQPIALAAMSGVISLILLIWLVRSPSLFVACALGAVIGGALGNSLDRIRLGAVVDFADFHIAGYHWPAFNIADSAIFIGVVLLCIHSMFMEPKIKGSEQ